jgi:hypothetical protein
MYECMMIDDRCRKARKCRTQNVAVSPYKTKLLMEHLLISSVPVITPLSGDIKSWGSRTPRNNTVMPTNATEHK